MTQIIFEVTRMPIKAKILGARVPVKKLDCRSMQTTGGKVKIPKGFSLGAMLLTTPKTPAAIADRKEGTQLVCYQARKHTRNDSLDKFSKFDLLHTFVSVDIKVYTMGSHSFKGTAT